MALKTYNQNCGLARALDILGDRWTLLVVRGLLGGPLRFSALQAQLPGIGANLLADRLKSLSHHAVVTKGDGQQGEYRLTEKGEALRLVVLGLARWGRGFAPGPTARSHPAWTMFNFEAAFRPERAAELAGLSAVIEFRLAQSVFHLVIRNQQCRALPGAAVSPDVRLISGSEQLLEKGARVQIQGDASVFDRVRPCFAL